MRETAKLKVLFNSMFIKSVQSELDQFFIKI